MKIISKNFRNKPILKDTIFLCISIRSNEFSMDRDIQKTKMIVDALQHNGFKANKPYNRYDAIFSRFTEIYQNEGGGY